MSSYTRVSGHAAIPRKHPTLLWADRLDRLFITALLPALTDPAVSLLPSGALSLNASGPELAYRAELQLQGEVLPGESEWFSTSQKIELTIVKAARSRWTQLLKAGSDYPGDVRTDWQKYLDHDDELDEIEKKSGLRGPPVVGNPGFAKSVDDYYRRKRIEKRESNDFPDLDTVSKLAEKEHARVGGDFNAIVQRLWADAKRDLELQREKERQEDAWAEGADVEEVQAEPASGGGSEAAVGAAAGAAAGQIRRKFGGGGGGGGSGGGGGETAKGGGEEAATAAGGGQGKKKKRRRRRKEEL